MASPLILRIAVKSDDAPLDATNQKLRAFQGEMQKATVTAQGSKEEIKKFTEQIKKIGQETPTAGQSAVKSFEGILKQVRPLFTQIFLLRRAMGIGALLAVPFTLAAKSIIDVNQKLIPLRTSLEQLGQASQGETTRFLNFINNLTFGTTTSVGEGIAALSVYIDKTKSTANAENVLSAAHTLAIAKGMKLAETTAAIASALNGDTTALANMTLKTKEEISNLVKSGELTKTIQKNFSTAANEAQSGIFNTFKRLGVTMWRGMVAGSIGQVDTFVKTIKEATNETKGFENFRKTLETLGNTKISFNSLDALRVSLGRINQAVAETKAQLKNPFVTGEQKDSLAKLLPILQGQYTVVQDQLKSEMQLASSERNRLKTEAAVLGLQAQLFVEQNRALKTVDESNESLERQKMIRKEILDAQLEQIHAESLAEARQILTQEHGITPEQTASIAAKETERKNQAVEASYKLESATNLKILDSDTKLQRARVDLQKFYLQNKLRQYSGVTAEQTYRIENQFVEKEVQFAIEAAKREAQQLLSEHRLTASEEARIETELQLKLTQLRKEAEDTRGKETQTRLERLTTTQQARVRELVSKFSQSGGIGLFTEKDELEKYKKMSDEKVDIAKKQQEALVRYFGEETKISAEKTSVPGGLVGDLQNMVKNQRVTIDEYYHTGLAKLKTELQTALTPDEKETMSKTQKFITDTQTVLNKTPLKVPVNFESIIDISSFVAKFILEVQRRMSSANVAAIMGQGAEQGGSES
jgi:hypothetical protein